MFLVATCIWVDHLRKGDAVLERLLLRGEVLTHPFVAGELALGSLRRRDLILGMLAQLPQTQGTDDEVLRCISRWSLAGLGIGYIDAHLLAAVALTPGALLWTRDARLRSVAERLKLHGQPA